VPVAPPYDDPRLPELARIEDALTLVNAFERSGTLILGLEGFVVDERGHWPQGDMLADFSELCAELRPARERVRRSAAAARRVLWRWLHERPGTFIVFVLEPAGGCRPE